MSTSSPPPRPTKGPRACLTCAKAKARCVPGPPGLAICERCHRLSKPCPLQTPAPPRPKKVLKMTRVAKLERRLDDLTRQLRVVGNQGSAGVSEQARVTEERIGSVEGLGLREGEEQVEETAEEQDWDGPMVIADTNGEPAPKKRKRAGENSLSMGHLFPASNDSSSPLPSHSTRLSSPASPTTETPTSIASAITPASTAPSILSSRPHGDTSHVWPSGSSPEAAALVGDFIAHRLPIFPFVRIPSDMDVQTFSVERPLLFRAVIMAEIFFEGTRQMAAMQELMELLVQASFLGKPQKSLDLLQALEIVLAWMHFDLNGFQLTNLLFLARGLCVNMARGAFEGTGEVDEVGLENLRAFAGVYYLNTYVFITNKRADSHLDVDSVDNWCNIIERNSTDVGDRFLLHLIRIQKLSYTVSLTISQAHVTSKSPTPSTPLEMVIRNFEQEIHSFKMMIPREFSESTTLLSHIAIAEALLYEVALSDTTTRYLKPQHRLDILWRCATAIRTYLSLRFPPGFTGYEIHDPQHITKRLICLSSYDFAYCILTSLKLLILRVPGWNRAIVVEQLDLMKTIDIQIQEMDMLIETRSMRRSKLSNRTFVPDPFERLLNTLRNLRVLLEKELERIMSESAMVLENAVAAADKVIDVAEVLNEDMPQNHHHFRKTSLQMPRMPASNVSHKLLSVGLSERGATVSPAMATATVTAAPTQTVSSSNAPVANVPVVDRYQMGEAIPMMHPQMVPINMGPMDGFYPIIQDFEESLWGEFTEAGWWEGGGNW